MLFVKLDASYADDPKIIDAGEKAEVLYVRALCLVKRILSDGFVADSHLPRFMLSGVEARARSLCKAGLWERDDERKGYWISSWLEHNPSRADVKEVSRKRAAAGAKGGKARAQANREANAKQVAYPETESETESAAETLAAAAAPDIYRDACRLLAERKADKLEPRQDRAGYIHAVALGKLKDHEDAARRLLDSEGGWTAESLADALEPTPKPKLRPVPGVKPSCSLDVCGGAGIVEQDDGSFTECGCKWVEAS